MATPPLKFAGKEEMQYVQYGVLAVTVVPEEEESNVLHLGGNSSQFQTSVSV